MINQKDTSKYDEMYAAWQAGKITDDQWRDFCMQMLSKIMDDTKDVFMRLKHR